MVKGKVLSYRCFFSKMGKPLTNITVLFDNGQVANVLTQGSNEFTRDQVVQFDVVPSGQYLTASLSLIVK